MVSLTKSDLWRDGGSISAVVHDGQDHRSFWLQTNRWDHPRDAGHENLFVSQGNDPQLKQQKIAPSSAEERHWIDYLDRVDDAGASPNSREVFGDMIRILRSRHKDSR